MIWAVGMTLNIIALGKAGPAISYGLGQGATHGRRSVGRVHLARVPRRPPGTGRLILLMFAGYAVGLALLVLAGA